MENKTTKERLQELQELHSEGYVTEGELKTARVHILKEGGIDIVTQLHHTRRQYLQDEEETRSGGGCGCFLTTLLLAAVFIGGVAFFAAPYWPENFGGAQARAAREWVTEKSAGLIDKMLGGSPEDLEIPDPVSSGDERPKEEPRAAEPEQPVSADESAAVPIPTAEPDPVHDENAFIVSIDVPALPQSPELGSEEPASVTPVTVTPIPYTPVTGTPVSAEETETPPSVEPASFDIRAEGVVHGTVTSQSVRIRSAPDTSTNDNVIGWGRRGDRFAVMEEGSGTDGSVWYHVMYEDGSKSGWISGALVRPDN